jgi:hypothetical protein
LDDTVPTLATRLVIDEKTYGAPTFEQAMPKFDTGYLARENRND